MDVIARADAVHAARVRAREAGVSEIANALLEQAERVETRLRMLQINEVSYADIAFAGGDDKRPFAGGGGSEASMYDASFQGIQVAAKVFSLGGGLSAQTDNKMREVRREFVALKRAQEHHPPTNTCIALPHTALLSSPPIHQPSLPVYQYSLPFHRHSLPHMHMHSLYAPVLPCTCTGTCAHVLPVHVYLCMC